VGEHAADQVQLGDRSYLQATLEVIADQYRSKGWAHNEHCLRAAVQDVSSLTAIRASYAEFQTTRDLHELARSVGNILGAADE
jgi:hypothetical protein